MPIKKTLSDEERRKRHNESSKKCYHKYKEDPEKIAAMKARHKVDARHYWEKHKDDPEYKAKASAKRIAWRNKMLADPNTADILREKEKNVHKINRAKGKVRYTPDFTSVENYSEAAKVNFNPQKFVCHHRLENYYRRESLIQKNQYHNLPASQLIWMEYKEHKVDSASSMSAPLDSKYHKSLFDVLKNTLALADRNKLPEEFEKLVSDVDDHYFDYLTEEYLGREKLMEFMEIYRKIESFKKEFLHYYMAMYLVELGKKNLW